MMEWKRLLTTARDLPPGANSNADGRSEFQRDQDRILFSHAFRRLQGKTQVHPMPANDHVHNRLTHTLEVSSVGRSLGELVGRRLQAEQRLPDGIDFHDVGAVVRAACLTHDLGNPPFGHAGEYAIRSWYRKHGARELRGVSPEALFDFQNFEGNAQGFRIATALETNPGRGGMRLTFATLATFQKYPYGSGEGVRRADDNPNKVKFGYYTSETDAFRRAAAATGLPEIAPGLHGRHPLAYLVEAADDICYAIVDLEDGIELKIVPIRAFEDILLSVSDDAVRREYAELGDAPDRQKAAWLRGRAMGFLIGDVVRAFAESETELLAGKEVGPLIERCAPAVHACVEDAKRLAREQIFVYTRKTEIEIGAYAAMDVLLAAFVEAASESAVAKSRNDLSFKTRRIHDLMQSEAPPIGGDAEECHRRALDFVAGMTDSYAAYLAAQLRGDVG